MAEVSSVRLLTPAFVALTLSDLAYFAGTGVLIAATPLFVTGPLGSDEAGVGVAMGSFGVTTLLLRPLAGRWTDRRGRRALLVGGATMFAVVVLGHYLVTGLVGLVALRLVLGAAEAMYFVAGFAALADLAPPGRAGEALSLNSLALYVGVATGPLIGQGLLRWGGFDLAWAGAVALVALAALLATRVPETRPTVNPDLPPTPLLHRAAIVPGLGLFCGVAAMAGFLAFAVLHARAVGIEAWSAVLLLFGGTVVACRVVFAKLADRVDPLNLAAAALGAVAAGFAVVGAVQTPFGLVAGTVVLAVGTAFLTPAVFAAVFGAVPAGERGSAAATTSVFIDLGLSGGPMLLGLTAASTSIPTAFLLLAGVPVVGGCLLVVTGHRRAAVA
jgi:MFS family permease